MRKSATRTSVDGSASSPEVTLDRRSVLGFKGDEGGIQELTPWNHDDVEAGRDSTATEDLSH